MTYFSELKDWAVFYAVASGRVLLWMKTPAHLSGWVGGGNAVCLDLQSHRFFRVRTFDEDDQVSVHDFQLFLVEFRNWCRSERTVYLDPFVLEFILPWDDPMYREVFPFGLLGAGA